MAAGTDLRDCESSDPWGPDGRRRGCGLARRAEPAPLCRTRPSCHRELARGIRCGTKAARLRGLAGCAVPGNVHGSGSAGGVDARRGRRRACVYEVHGHITEWIWTREPHQRRGSGSETRRSDDERAVHVSRGTQLALTGPLIGFEPTTPCFAEVAHRPWLSMDVRLRWLPICRVFDMLLPGHALVIRSPYGLPPCRRAGGLRAAGLRVLASQLLPEQGSRGEGRRARSNHPLRSPS